jgi:thiamine-monophosphate kinase
MQTLGEFEVIERFFTRATDDRDVLIGIGDDAAVLDAQGPLAVTVDTLTAGVHFPENFAPHALGHRALAVNLSDIAAMGVEPRWCSLALTLPEIAEDWLTELARGFFDLAEQHGVSLVGGNLSRGPLSISVQLLGTLAGDRFVTRAGARAGDDLYVTGTLGDAAAGLAVLEAGEPTSDAARALVERFMYPTPRIAAGRALASLATAAIDISDGLAADIAHLLRRSGRGAVVDIESVPVSEALCGECAAPVALEHALAGGDDYELCFAAERDDAEAIAAAFRDLGLRVSRIGRLTDDASLIWRRNGAAVDVAGGYRHF